MVTTLRNAADPRSPTDDVKGGRSAFPQDQQAGGLGGVGLLSALLIYIFLTGLSIRMGISVSEQVIGVDTERSFLMRMVMNGGALLMIVLSAVALMRSSVYERPFTSRMQTYLVLSFVLYMGVVFLRALFAAPANISTLRIGMYGFVITSLCMSLKETSYGRVYRVIRAFVWTTSFVTMVLLPIAPDYVLMSGFSELLPGIDFRLHGFWHANHLSYICVLYLFCPRPGGSRRWWEYVGDGIVLCVFLLCQSKTSFILLLAGIFVRISFKLVADSRTAVKLLFLSAEIVALGIGVYLLQDQIKGAVTRNTALDARNVETATNRTLIWDATLAEWRKRPLLGFGASAWDKEIMRQGSWAAGDAHNQFVQVLWETGLVGAFFFALHAWFILLAGLSVRSSIQPALVSVVMSFFIRFFSEVGVGVIHPYDLRCAAYVIVLTVIVTSLNKRQETIAAG